MVSIDPQSFKRSIASMREYPAVALSYTAYKVLTALFMLIPPPAPQGIPIFSALPALSYVFVFFAVAIWCILFAVFGRDAKFFERRGYLLGSGALIVMGLVFLCVESLASTTPVLELILFACGVIALSAGYSAIHIEFGRLMGELGMTYTLIFNIGCLILAIPLTGLALILPRLAQFACILALIAGCTLFLDRAIDGLGRDRLYRGTDAPLSIPTRFMFTSFTQGISAGLLFTAFSTTFIQMFWGESLSGACSAIAALLFGLTFRIDFDRLVYRIGFACAGIGCTIWAIAGNCAALRDLSSFLQLCAFTYLDIVLWSLGSHLIKDRNQPALWVAACPTASLLLGRCVGSVLGIIVSTNTPQEFFEGTLYAVDAPAAVGAVAGCAFMFIAMQLSSGRNIENGWGFIKPNESNTMSTIEHTCSMIAGDFHLTEREADVLLLLARGKTKKEIAEELYITQNTIKTHQRNLYTKLDVHSLDELRQFVAHQQGAFDFHGEI